MPVTTKIDRLNAVKRAVVAMSSQRVLIGIPEDKDHRDPEPGEKSEPLGNAAIGYIMENGAPEVNIPPRPFLVPGVASKQGEYARRFEKGAKDALSGNDPDVSRILNQVGLLGSTAVKNYMVNHPFQPLADRTLDARKRRGVTRTKPLVDTTQLLNSVTYVIKKNGFWTRVSDAASIVRKGLK